MHIKRETVEKIGHGFVTVTSIVLIVLTLATVSNASGFTDQGAQAESVSMELMDRYDMRTINQISDALDGVLSIDKVYWLSDDDPVAPKPDPAK